MRHISQTPMMSIACFFLLALAQTSHAAKYVMYLTGQHDILPELALVAHITHVQLAFMPSSIFNEEHPSSYPLFTSVETVRSHFAPSTAVTVAIGGWGDTNGFSKAAATEKSRKLFAKNVKAMVDSTGADGVDIDWEYPGGNGEDYKQVPNTSKVWEIEAYPKLLCAVRSALGSTKLISAAVPGLRRDMLAFTPDCIPAISASLDFFNIMTYDLMNRRDNVTKHHTGINLSLDAINAYLEIGVQPEKVNLGFGFYVKWFRTDPKAHCEEKPIGCKTLLLEDPATGADLGRAGQFAWCDDIPVQLEVSFRKALQGKKYDDYEGGNYYFDPEEDLFWSWDTPDAISKKIPCILAEKNLGGVFAWGLGEDSEEWKHLKALTEGFLKFSRRTDWRTQDEL